MWSAPSEDGDVPEGGAEEARGRTSSTLGKIDSLANRDANITPGDGEGRALADESRCPARGKRTFRVICVMAHAACSARETRITFSYCYSGFCGGGNPLHRNVDTAGMVV
ncbi:hypothetical protein GCM10027294_03420 [Marinactinospora endophytica]